MDQEFESIFYRFEDLLQEKSVLVGVAPKSMVGVQLQPESYIDQGEKKYKIKIIVEVSKKEVVDESVFEAIADTVSDYLRDNDIESELARVGIDLESLDWYTVSYQYVGASQTENKPAQSDRYDKKIGLIFKKHETILRLSGILEDLDIQPEDIVLTGEFYGDKGEEKLKAVIKINSYEIDVLDDDDRESIADTISDLLRDNGISEDLSKLGLDPSILDWYQIISAADLNENKDKDVESTKLTDLQELALKYTDNSSIYIGSNLPTKKTYNAIKEYAAGVEQNQILVFVDTTLFGSGKEGFLITLDRVYTKPSMGEANSIAIAEFKKAYLKEESFGYVYIEDKRIITAPRTLRKFVEFLVEFLKRVEV